MIEHCVVVVDHDFTLSLLLFIAFLLFSHCSTLICLWSYFAPLKVAYGLTKCLSNPKLSLLFYYIISTNSFLLIFSIKKEGNRSADFRHLNNTQEMCLLASLRLIVVVPLWPSHMVLHLQSAWVNNGQILLTAMHMSPVSVQWFQA